MPYWYMYGSVNKYYDKIYLLPLFYLGLGNWKLGNILYINHPNFFFMGICSEFSFIAGDNIINPFNYLLVNLLAKQNATTPPKLVPSI